MSIGETLVQLKANVRGGCIIFLPSYAYLAKLLAALKGTPVWRQMQATKEVCASRFLCVTFILNGKPKDLFGIARCQRHGCNAWRV